MWVWAAGRKCWLDLAVEEMKLGVEADGWTVHSRGEAFHTDRERQNALTKAGWIVLRYTPRQLRHDMAGVIAEIRSVEAKLSVVSRR